MNSICPNCGQPRTIHDLFSPPRCPVIRLAITKDPVVAPAHLVTYSNVARPE